MFKVGDKVKCIDSQKCFNLTLGKVYTIKYLDGNGICIKADDNYFHYYSRTYFEKVEDNNMELKITKEKVLEAANKCNQVKETLKTLFPEVFEDDKSVDVRIVEGKSFFNNHFLTVRADYEYKHKGFYLTREYNWEIIKDSQGELVLVPTKK